MATEPTAAGQAALSRRQARNLVIWAKDRRLLKCREVDELNDLGLIKWVDRKFALGHATYPVLTAKAKAILGNKRVAREYADE